MQRGHVCHFKAAYDKLRVVLVWCLELYAHEHTCNFNHDIFLGTQESSGQRLSPPILTANN
jgi:hypothetical protein